MSSQDSTTRQTVNNLSRGLITEATDLTFPEGATTDELNCDLDVTGLRKRRLGIAVESGATYYNGPQDSSEMFRTLLWERVGDIPDLEFIVTQINNRIQFYERRGTEISNTAKDFIIDLDNYVPTNGEFDPAEHPISVSSIQGWLVISNKACESLLVKYLETDDIDVSVIDFKVRDFERLYQTDNKFDVAPATLTKEYKYDLLNMGWDEGKINSFKASQGVLPPRNLHWWSGKDADGNFNAGDYVEVYAGTSFAGNGHYILDLFNKDRTDSSGVANIPVEIDTGRFSTNVVFGGRVFYAGISTGMKSSRVYFSNTIINESDLGILHQVGDPVSEVTPDIVATDGGVVNIGEADTIKELFVYGNSLLVFANNGVWMISGPDGFFTAESFVVDKISTEGIASRDSLVDVKGTPMWWGKTGIYTAIRNDINDRPIVENVSRQSIQTFYNAIDLVSRETCVGVFDKVDEIVYWMYSSNAESYHDCRFDRMLLFHAPLRAFYPRAIENNDEEYHVIGGFFNYPSNTGLMDDDVYVESDLVNEDVNQVIMSASFQITDNLSDAARIRFLLFTPEGISFGGFEDTDFKDWGQWDAPAYFETGYNFVGDLWQDKTLDALIMYYTLTETGVDADYKPVNASSALLRVKWDGATSAATGKWSRQYQSYRLQRVPTPSGPSTDLDFGYNKVKTINRIRGSGDSLRIRVDSEPEKNLKFQGYEMVAAKGKIYV